MVLVCFPVAEGHPAASSITSALISSRLAKSTLSLIPLLGIHQVAFVFVTDESSEKTLNLRLTKVVIDLFVTSFQVSVLCARGASSA